MEKEENNTISGNYRIHSHRVRTPQRPQLKLQHYPQDILIEYVFTESYWSDLLG